MESQAPSPLQKPREGKCLAQGHTAHRRQSPQRLQSPDSLHHSPGWTTAARPPASCLAPSGHQGARPNPAQTAAGLAPTWWGSPDCPRKEAFLNLVFTAVRISLHNGQRAFLCLLVPWVQSSWSAVPLPAPCRPGLSCLLHSFPADWSLSEAVPPHRGPSPAFSGWRVHVCCGVRGGAGRPGPPSPKCQERASWRGHRAPPPRCAILGQWLPLSGPRSSHLRTGEAWGGGWAWPAGTAALRGRGLRLRLPGVYLGGLAESERKAGVPAPLRRTWLCGPRSPASPLGGPTDPGALNWPGFG